MSWSLRRRPACLRPTNLRPTSKLRRRLPMEALERRNLMAVVATEFGDYMPGDTAQVFAAGFHAGEAVEFQVLHNDGTPNSGNGHLPWTVVDGSAADLDGLADGNIHTTWYVDPDDSRGSSFDLNAHGLSSGLFAHNTFTDAGSTLSQFANKPATNYQTGSLNAVNSAYTEGNSIPFRYLVSDLQEGANVVLDIIYQFQSSASGPRTYDFLTSDNVSQTLTDTERFGPANASKPSGFGLTSSTNLLLVAIPDDSGSGVDTGGFFRIASNVSVSLVSISAPVVTGNPDEKMIRMVLHLGTDGDATPNEQIVDLGVFWGGHLARDNDYAGTNNGASDAPGASFHMRTEGFQDINGNGIREAGDDSLGGGDRSIQGGVVVHTSLAWEKRRADNNQLLGGATFQISPNPLGGAGTFTVTDNGLGDADPDAGQVQLDDIAFGTYTITEIAAPPGYAIDPDPTRVQAVTSAAPIAVVGSMDTNDAGTTDDSDFHNPLQVFNPQIAINKVTEDGPVSGDGIHVLAGETISWRYTVTNVGDVPLANISVTDNQPGVSPVFQSGDTNSNALLDLTEAWIYLATGTSVVGDYANTGTASGNFTSVLGQSVTVMDDDTSSYFGADPQIAIDKITLSGSQSGDGIVVLAGAPVTWQYTVRAVGNVSLANIAVTDNQPGVSPTYQNGDANSNGLLDQGEAWIYTATGLATAGSYANTGTASGRFTDQAGHIASDVANDDSSYFGSAPAILIDKVTVDDSVAGDGIYVLAGEPISWRYTVTNAGNVALGGVTVTDNQPGVLPVFQSGDANSNGLLDLGEAWVYLANGTSVVGDYTNEGVATGTAAGVTVMDGDTSSYFGADPQISIDKITISGSQSGDGILVLAGAPVTWQYTVRAVGNVSLALITVTDSQPGVTPTYQSGDANSNGILDKEETWIYSATGVAIAGAYSNTGTASGKFTDQAGHIGRDFASDDSSYFGAAPAIMIDKVTVDGPVAGDGIYVLAGEPISWRYTVTNVGNVPLANVTVTDNQPGVSPAYQSGDADSNGLLDLGEAWVFVATGTSVVGDYANEGVASGTAAGVTVMDGDTSSYFGADPQIAIDKVTLCDEASGDGITVMAGSTVTWRYTVRAVGNVSLALITVTDNQPGVTPTYQSGDTNSNGILDKEETWIYTATGVATAGAYSNTGTASGKFTDQAGHIGRDFASDDSSYFGAAPSINVDKVTVDASNIGDGLVILVGEPISWRYTVTNTGNVALANVNVADNQPGVSPVYQSGDVNSNGLLDLTEAWVFAASGTSLAGAYANTGTATSSFTDDCGELANVADGDDSSYFGAAPNIAIDKVTIDGGNVGDGLLILAGEPISWRYTVTNTGNVALANVAVADNQPGVSPIYQSGDVNSNGLLDLSEVWVYAASGTSVAGAYANTGTATGNFTDGAGHVANVADGDDSSYFGAAPSIDIDKVTVDGPISGDGLVIFAGEPISWRYTVTNTGNVAVANVAVTDNQPGVSPAYQSGDANSNGLLDLSEVWVYTASGTAVAGGYFNRGTVTGNFTDGAGHVANVADGDDSSYFGAAPGVAINKVTVSGATVGDGITVRTGDPITWRYTVTNTGNVALGNIVVSDNQPGVSPAYQSGDVNANGQLDLGETWVFTAAGVAVTGPYSNVGKVTGNATDTAGHAAMVMASDASSYFGHRDIIVIGPDKQNTATSLVRVIDRATGQQLSQFYAYEPNFRGGVRLATADMDGDGIDEIVTAPGRSRAPEVRVFRQDGTELTKFRTMAYASSFMGGVEVAVGDVNGDGRNDIVTVPTAGPTQARVFFNNYNPANPNADPIPNAPNKQFSVFASNFQGGADVALADVGTFSNGTTVNATTPDGKAELIISNGPGMRSTIYVYDVTGAPKVVDTILPFDNVFKGGITIDTARVNGDQIPDIIVSAGNGGQSRVQVFSGLTNDAVDAVLSNFQAFGNTPTKNAPVHTTAVDINNDGIVDRFVAVQGTDGTSNQIRSFNLNGTPAATLNGFNGSWNIARIRRPLPRLVDAVFARLN